MSMGWTGKILRVDLSTGRISTEPTDKYRQYIGGNGIGYKVLFDEVPPGTHPYSEYNKLVIATGPLTGTGTPLSGRTTITSLLASNLYHAVADGHIGGNLGPYMKYAGWDAIIIEGKADKPVWLKIDNDKVSIEDASHLWGKGTVQTTYEISKVLGKECCVAAIGPAGENMVNMSTIVCSVNHSAGGHGGVMGSKNLKAIGVRGNQPVKVAKVDEFLKLNKYMTDEILGGNNNHSVPRDPQGWNEYWNPSSRWNATRGLYWGAANPPVETGICPPGDMNRVAYRSFKAVFDLGPLAEPRTVKMSGCHSCPVRCHSNIYVPELEQYGYTPTASGTCIPWSHVTGSMLKGYSDGQSQGTVRIITQALGSRVADDLGIWSNYSQLGRDFRYAYDKGILEKVLPSDEYKSLPLHLMEAGDPRWVIEFYTRIAHKQGEFGTALGLGAAWIAQRWNYGDDFFDSYSYNMWSRLGYPKHHSNETANQVGSLINTHFNRDAQSHTVQNFWQCGLPWGLMKEIAGEIFGSPDALDLPNQYTPMNVYKARFAKWGIDRNMLHDALTLCNYTWPMTVSPSKSRNYRGDLALEAKFFSAVTGIETSMEELDLAAERITTLHRALTMKNMNTVDMRNQHDLIPKWAFEYPYDKKPFEPGSNKLDREDMEVAKSMFYKEYGWDEKTGAPTRARLEELGMKDIADGLAKLNLLPA